jgi:putative ABC transport system permease protein
MGNIWQDARYALRALKNNPGFAIIAVLTLALGIGANTALFSIVNGVLLSPLPYPHPEQLVALYSKTPEFRHSSISYPNFLDWQRSNTAFSAIASFRRDSFNLTGTGDAEHLHGNMVSAAFFPILQVQPLSGRNFTEAEDKLGAAPVALISEGLAKRKFGSADQAVGRTLTLNGALYQVVGVIPASFHLDRENNYDNKAEVYVPIGQWSEPLFRDRKTGMGMNGLGRLKPNFTLQQADADMRSVAANLAETYPEIDKGSGVTVVSLKEDLVGDIRPFLLVLLAAVGFVLLIACANVANLLLARSTGRTREFAIRTAMGAERSRLIGQLLTESVLLALAGGALGILVAAWCTAAAIKVLPDALPRAGEIHLDVRVLLFTFGLSILSGILFGLAPAFKTSQVQISETLKEGGRGGSDTRHRTQSVFVALEMAMAVVLLVAAGLMIRSMAHLWNTNPGFDAQNVENFSVATSRPLGDSPAAIRAGFVSLREALRSVPGVQSVSISVGSEPMESDSDVPFWLDSEPKPASEHDMKSTLFYITQSDYIDVMKVPLLRGRFLQDSDTDKTTPVVVIDQKFATLYFHDANPIGHHVHFDILNEDAEVVGVVGHVNQWGLDQDATSKLQGQAYLPVAQIPDALLSNFSTSLRFVARTNSAPQSILNPVRQKLASINGEMVMYNSESMTDVISDSLSSQRFAMILLGVFAALALILASIGIYGVLSYVVGQRTREIGIRMALGAAPMAVLQMVLRQAGAMVLWGLGVGLLAAIGLTRLMSSMLFGVSPTDPVTLLGVAALLALVALAACYVPAYRATQVDPITALRYE